MNRIVIGAIAALMLVASGLFWWQGRAESAKSAPPPMFAADVPATSDPIPDADGRGLRGPAPPEATELTREQKRFDHVDKDRDGRITRNELLAPRVAAFRKMDLDHNNLLSFDEWSVKTLNRFKSADANGDSALTRPEFATTRAKKNAAPKCRCATKPAKVVRGRAAPPEIPELESDSGDPEL